MAFVAYPIMELALQINIGSTCRFHVHLSLSGSTKHHPCWVVQWLEEAGDSRAVHDCAPVVIEVESTDQSIGANVEAGRRP